MTDDSVAARPPALLADVTWYGTLAAVRDLGSRGVPVTLACDAALAPARWSRYVTSVVRCPRTEDHEEFLGWLHAFGDEHPGYVLYPTSDDAAWLIAQHLAELAPKYRLYSPPPEVLATLLDKGRLTQAARAAGLDTAEQWLPEEERDVERIAREAPFPLFVKPRTRLLAPEGMKGSRVDRPEDLVRTWRTFRASEESERQLGSAMTGAARPLILRCYPESESIYTVDGFVDRAGGMVALGCNKLLQHPRRMGPGILFEDAPIPPAVLSGLERLFAGAGFFGVFDTEFIVAGDRLLIIDVNPRFYNHMAFEMARDLPLPWLAYLGALGDEAAVRAAMKAPRPSADGGRLAYVHRLPTALMLAFQGAAGTMSRAEIQKRRRWLAEYAGHIIDPARDRGDPMPGYADFAYYATRFLRHPRAFLRDLWRDREPVPRAR